jgi:hypothetical protein
VGISVASASQSDSLTDHLIAQLDDYRRYGVNTIDVFFQGSSGGFSDPFLKKRKAIEKAHLRRMKKILDACDARGMVVIVGIFYQRAMANIDGVREINDAEGVRNAVKAVAKALRGYKNLILNIANEQNSGYYKRCGFFNFNDPKEIIALCKLAKSVAPEMLVGDLGGMGTIDDPGVLEPNLSLISSISNSSLPVENFASHIMWDDEKKSETVMKTAAVLTCLNEIPPRNSFRPPYAGTGKPLFTSDDILWDQLPALAPAGRAVVGSI